jgi:hypothetical protein
LYLGDHHAAASLEFMTKSRIGLVINATRHIRNHFEGSGIEYFKMLCDDTQDDARSTMEVNIEEALGRIDDALGRGINVLVHCHRYGVRGTGYYLYYLCYLCCSCYLCYLYYLSHFRYLSFSFLSFSLFVLYLSYAVA